MKNNLALSKLDNLIVELIEQRNRLLSGSLEKGDNTASISGSSPLFREPFCKDTAISAKPYEEILPGILISFKADSGMEVLLQQFDKVEPTASPPDHHFLFSVNLRQAGTSAWLALEHDLREVTRTSKLNINVALKVKSTYPEILQIILFLLNPHDQEELAKIRLGELSTPDGGGYGHLSLSSTIELANHVTKADGKLIHPRLGVFMPPSRPANFEFAMLTILTSYSG